MRRRFSGEATLKVDGKGRTSIPANFRRAIEAGDPDWVQGKPANMVIVYGDERRNFLECYTMQGIAEIDRKLSKMKLGSPARDYLEDMFGSKSTEISVEPNGRTVLPKICREKIAIADEAYFQSKVSTFRIYKPETYAATPKVDPAEIYKDLEPGSDMLALLPGDADG